jgi:hypothetical protein
MVHHLLRRWPDRRLTTGCMWFASKTGCEDCLLKVTGICSGDLSSRSRSFPTGPISFGALDIKLSPDILRRMTPLTTLQLHGIQQPSAGKPVYDKFKVDKFAASLFGLQADVEAESITFRYQIDPWTIKATDGRVLWVLSNISTTYVRALNPQTGVIVCNETLHFNGTPKGFRPNPPGNHLHQYTLNSAQGVLEDWDTGIPNADVLTIFTYTKSFTPDFFDLIDSSELVLDGGTWTRIA